MKYLEVHHTLNDFQYGFGSGHSCSPYTDITEEIQYALDYHHYVNLIMLDFCKGSDTVAQLSSNWNFIVSKEKYMIGCLTQRTQYVVLNGFSSNYIKVESDGCQGTVFA